MDMSRSVGDGGKFMFENRRFFYDGFGQLTPHWVGCAHLTPPSSRQSGRVGAAGSLAFGKYNYVTRSFPDFFWGPVGSLWMAKQYRGVSQWGVSRSGIA